MTAARGLSSRGRAARLVAAFGCAATGTAACTSSTNSALGQGTFTYVCSSSDATEPGPDAWCDTTANRGAIPDVAVGAPFQIGYGAGPPQPAVSALAQPASPGWSLVQPGWLGFIVWSGSDVLDYTQVLGRSVATLRLQPETLAIAVGEGPTSVAAVPLADDGTTLGGAIACTFVSSDPDSVAVTGQGRVARLSAGAPGRDAVVTATCMGQQAQCRVHTGTAGTLSDATASGASADASAEGLPNVESE